MKTETIRNITIEDFKRDPHLIDYVDENLIVLDSVEATLPDSDPVKLDCFIIAFCMEGEASIHINTQVHGKGERRQRDTPLCGVLCRQALLFAQASVHRHHKKNEV